MDDEDTGADAGQFFELKTDQSAVCYRFVAKRVRRNQWHIEPTLVTRAVDGVCAPLDAAALLVELREPLGPVGQCPQPQCGGNRPHVAHNGLQALPNIVSPVPGLAAGRSG